jgi:hypothetical protein
VLVDGTLDEEVWKTATAVADFTQRDPDQGVPPRQKTEVRIAYDDDAVYVGARMFDTAPDSVVARVARRDNSANSDMFTILLTRCTTSAPATTSRSPPVACSWTACS